MKLSVICGGRSAEHEVSLVSAKHVIDALDPERYDLTVIYIARDGAWYRLPDVEGLSQAPAYQPLDVTQLQPISININDSAQPWYSISEAKSYPVDCVFPLVHGTDGEDGALQGLLEVLDIPYVGSDVLGSAICMEKHITKRLLRFAGLPVVDWQLISETDPQAVTFSELVSRWGEQMFIKPVALGSSVGIAKIHNEQQFQAALKEAFLYDRQVIVEPAIVGREIECSVLGNGKPEASLPGEVITHHDFYSYDAKYLDPEGAKIVSPAQLPDDIIAKIQAMSVQAFKVLHCYGMARVDFFVADNEVLINEVNTIPGFTPISLYPKNWQASGISYPQLCERLINLAVEHHAAARKRT